MSFTNVLTSVLSQKDVRKGFDFVGQKILHNAVFVSSAVGYFRMRRLNYLFPVRQRLTFVLLLKYFRVNPL